MKRKTIIMLLLACSLGLAGCSMGQTGIQSDEKQGTQTEASNAQNSESKDTEADANTDTNTGADTNTDGILDTSDLFTERDLAQSADLTDAVTYTVTDGEDIRITEEGVYVLQGSAADVTIYVEAEDTDKVQIVLDGVSITNSDMPCIYAVSADKVFVTTASDSKLSVTGTFVSDTENADAAIFSCADLTLNGTGTLTIDSSKVGVDTKDDLKVTGGTYVITAVTKAFEANDSIRIADGSFTLEAGTDGLHAENSEDDEKGYIYIAGGTFDIKAADDGIHGTSVVQIDGGTFVISAAEGIEGTYVQINDGNLTITASDDGINAGRKSNSYEVVVEITGGEISIAMGQGDTDAIDSNGNLMISGGTIDITAGSAFDYDGTGTYTGGTLTVNGETVTELTQSMMGGRGMGGRGMGAGDMGAGDMGAGGMRPDGMEDGNRGGKKMP